MLNTTELENRLLFAAQRGIAVVERPFAVLGDEFGVDENAVVNLLQRLLRSGEARRFGAVFDARRLNYRSALCCMEVCSGTLESMVSKIMPLSGVTHLYQRGWTDELPRDVIGGPRDAQWPNIWFTLAVPRDTYQQELDRLRATCAPCVIEELPAVRRFKIDVIFDMRPDKGQESRQLAVADIEMDSEESFELNDEERRIVRYFQGAVPVVPDFYRSAAEQLEIPVAELMNTLRAWLRTGIVRRLGLLLRHRLAGFKANGMCCWNVPEDEIVQAGHRLAAFSEVTHCYQRPPLAKFPFNLFAMIHTPSWERTQLLFRKLEQTCGLSHGALLLSLREFKKTSMRFFEV
jgi:siroheme decarboxylase